MHNIASTGLPLIPGGDDAFFASLPRAINPRASATLTDLYPRLAETYPPGRVLDLERVQTFTPYRTETTGVRLPCGCVFTFETALCERWGGRIFCESVYLIRLKVGTHQAVSTARRLQRAHRYIHIYDVPQGEENRHELLKPIDWERGHYVHPGTGLFIEIQTVALVCLNCNGCRKGDGQSPHTPW